MEQLALIADIHGNLPALKAVLKDIECRNIKRILCLGDVIGKGPSNPEVLDICIDLCEFILRGNWEEYVASYNPQESAIWVQQQIGKSRLEYIRNTKLSKEMWFSGKFLRLFHAHPNGFTRVFMHSSIEEKKQLFLDSENGIVSDIAGYADIHRPYMQIIDGKTLFNTGSVGNPLDIPMASYAILSGYTGIKDEAEYSVNFVRLPYDIQKAISDAYAAKDMPCLEDYIGEITECRYNRKKL